MKLKRIQFVAVVAVLALRLAACGGNPNGPSEGITLDGTVVGGSFGAASVSGASAASAVLTVVVDGHPEMVATITNGSFTLRGLPEGSFTLTFLSDGVPIGTLTFNEVKPNQALTVTVSITGSSVVLVEERRNGIGHGDLEIEGTIDQVIALVPAGDSRFLIDGYTVIARPGQTAIREGNRAKVAAELLPGQRVHVKGVWQAAAVGGAQEVLAWEIKMQGDVPTTGPSPTPGATCMINGGRVGAGIELEGRVASALRYPSFMMTVNGNRASGPVTSWPARCSAPRATAPIRRRPSVPGAFVDGARIHVRGTLTACDLASALVTASEVTVQELARPRRLVPPPPGQPGGAFFGLLLAFSWRGPVCPAPRRRR